MHKTHGSLCANIMFRSEISSKPSPDGLPNIREGDIPGWRLGSDEPPGRPQLSNPKVRKLKKSRMTDSRASKSRFLDGRYNDWLTINFIITSFE